MKAMEPVESPLVVKRARGYDVGRCRLSQHCTMLVRAEMVHRINESGAQMINFFLPFCLFFCWCQWMVAVTMLDTCARVCKSCSCQQPCPKKMMSWMVKVMELPSGVRATFYGVFTWSCWAHSEKQWPVHADDGPVVNGGGGTEWCEWVLLLVEVINHCNHDRFFQVW